MLTETVSKIINFFHM